jgi:hypothetical protein
MGNAAFPGPVERWSAFAGNDMWIADRERRRCEAPCGNLPCVSAAYKGGNPCGRGRNAARSASGAFHGLVTPAIARANLSRMEPERSYFRRIRAHDAHGLAPRSNSDLHGGRGRPNISVTTAHGAG